jgi:hypothetical protein
MFLLGRIRSLARLLFRSRALEADLDAEVRSYFEIMVERYMGQGMSETAARRRARSTFDAPELVKEQVRERRTGLVVSNLLRDLNYSLRSLRNAPVFVLVTVLALALRIGANATIFSIVNRFALRRAPVGAPGTLMALHTTTKNECCNAYSWPLFADLRDENKSLSSVAAYFELLPASISGRGEPERVGGQAATSNIDSSEKIVGGFRFRQFGK